MKFSSTNTDSEKSEKIWKKKGENFLMAIRALRLFITQFWGWKFSSHQLFSFPFCYFEPPQLFFFFKYIYFFVSVNQLHLHLKSVGIDYINILLFILILNNLYNKQGVLQIAYIFLQWEHFNSDLLVSSIFYTSHLRSYCSVSN